MKFSQRIGKTPVRAALQIEEIDIPLSNRIWNVFLSQFVNQLSKDSLRKVCNVLWKEFFVRMGDEIFTDTYGRIDVQRVIDFVKNWYLECLWYEKYNLIEFIVDIEERGKFETNFKRGCNSALRRESAGYRIVGRQVTQVTSEEEIASIEEALNSSSPWEPIETHLRTALYLLANREKPDYRNSIKESISAVESFCKIVTGDSNATLGKALSQIENTHEIHGSLKEALKKLYGYTSDSGGIRHALLEGDNSVQMEDAKFMLVSCSAFINYLKSKIQ